MTSAIPVITIIGIIVVIAAVLLDYSRPLPREIAEAGTGEAPPIVVQEQPDGFLDGQTDLMQLTIVALGSGLASMATGVEPGVPDRWMIGDGSPDQSQLVRLTVAFSAFSVIEEATGDTGMARNWLISDQGEEGTSAVELLRRNEFAAVLTFARLLAAQ